MPSARLIARRWGAFAFGAMLAAGAIWLANEPGPVGPPKGKEMSPASGVAPASAQREWQQIRQQFARAHAQPAKDFERIVWVADASALIEAHIGDATEARHIAEAIYDHARAFGLSPELVLAVVEVESGFDRFAVSTAGARGLMQVMPFWKERIGRKDDNLFDVATNLRYGCAILRHYLDAHSSLTKALAAYNGSEGSTRYPWKVFAVMRRFSGTR